MILAGDAAPLVPGCGGLDGRAARSGRANVASCPVRAGGAVTIEVRVIADRARATIVEALGRVTEDGLEVRLCVDLPELGLGPRLLDERVVLVLIEDCRFRFVTVAEEVGQRGRSHDEPALPETEPFGLSLRLDDLGPVDGVLVDPRVARVLPLTARRRPEDVEAAAVSDGREDVRQRPPRLLARRDLWRFRQAAALSGRAYRAVLGLRFRLSGDVVVLLQAGLGLGRQAGALVASVRERDEDEGERYEKEGSACNGDGEDPAYCQAAAAALFSGCHSRGHRDCCFVPSSKPIVVVNVTRRAVKQAENDWDASIETRQTKRMDDAALAGIKL
ncbi:hypothetical protein BN1723_011703 [Verticillium longisporum]|uniref:Uncharacterized protein n=1 Tax=Verticillium longisporum TaxID=100787 RepID=A0A0G4LAZ2_VERLO|nr:hypothetical protein BN1723_011703 [Verticillium longisporum]